MDFEMVENNLMSKPLLLYDFMQFSYNVLSSVLYLAKPTPLL
jgi:hypothetical protein